MEFKETVGNRRTIRYFQPDRPVEKAKVQKILEAARLQSQHGNAQLVRKAVVVTKGETPDDVRNGLIDALYNQPQAAQAPVAIVWVQDMSGWKPFKENLMNLMKANALPTGYGWSEDFIDNTDNAVLATEDFNISVNPNPHFAEWLTSFECGLAVGSALLAAVDEGLGTGLITGRREEIRKLFNMPETCTPTQVQLVGYAAENLDGGGGGACPRPDFGDLYFADTWGNALPRDPQVVEELKAAKLLQPEGPHLWRKAELNALAGMFGLPE
ncbi:MAG TPA: nitroreductase family protein [Sporichthyaceae bacterium]|jgi:nitroreductase|nr:nitroreductase family protein [Sporichthyaceae bacterium]